MPPHCLVVFTIISMHDHRSSSPANRWIAFVALVSALILARCTLADDSAPSEPLPATRLLTLDDSVRYALAHNPQLTALREQHGIAAAGVVIAKTYPFNPIYQGSFQDAQGPPGSVENPLLQQHQVTLEVELWHQRCYREQAAFAASKPYRLGDCCSRNDVCRQCDSSIRCRFVSTREVGGFGTSAPP